MKWVLIVIGIVLVIVGVIWLLQGSNVLSFGAMAGHRRWIALGALLGIVGIILIVAGARRRIAKTA